MDKRLQAAKAYLHEVLGVVNGSDGWGEPWAGAVQLPFYLQDQYTFHSVVLLDEPCLLMICRAADAETPAVVQKHWKLVSGRYAGDVIYMVESVSSFNRKRLIEQRVPFLVPGNQLFLPMLGIDLREHFKQRKTPGTQWLSAAAQLLVVRELLGRPARALPAKELAGLLTYSAMTLTRAIKELVDKGLATAEMVGREKRLAFTLGGRELWEEAKPYMHSPVKKRLWVAEHFYKQLLREVGAKKAGESALAEYSMMSEPNSPVLAVNASEWPGIKALMNIDEVDRRDAECIQIELWRYSPGGMKGSETVDPLSLWLSFDSTKDERIEMARDELLETTWSKSQW